MTLKIESLTKMYGSTEVLRDFSIEIPTGKLTAVIGRSGCGKSTLLRCIQGLEPFDAGRISFEDQVLTAEQSHHGANALRSWRSQFGMVFQSFHLFPHLTVEQNITTAPRVVRGLSEKDARDQAHALLEKVGLGKFAARFPSQLSGGQQQRAAIARALAMSPRVMLYDEPTSALDPWLVEEVLNVMKQLNGEGLTQILVTHEVGFARTMAHQVAFIHEGTLAESGTPERVFDAPERTETRIFLQKFFEKVAHSPT